MAEAKVGDRRQLATRKKPWAIALAHVLAKRGVTPNAISIFGVACALLAFLGFLGAHATDVPVGRAGFLLLAMAGIQLRLLCNLLDGMVAVEAGIGVGRYGEIFNDFPDRIADILIFTGAGLIAGPRTGMILAMAAAVGCLFTAYVRVMGKSLGARSHFEGPMAKQHRMFALTLSCLGGCVVVFTGRYLHVWMQCTLAIVCLGCAATVVNRLYKIVQDLAAK